jgi:hypothetical protein
MPIDQIPDKPQGGEGIGEDTDEFPAYGKGDDIRVGTLGNKPRGKEQEIEDEGLS